MRFRWVAALLLVIVTGSLYMGSAVTSDTSTQRPADADANTSGYLVSPP
ncbi:MAG: hypothetical protein ABIN96_01035 [Rubrivivax sp.]